MTKSACGQFYIREMTSNHHNNKHGYQLVHNYDHEWN